jgi:acyl-[acyl-carrier-protein]-phospholipid O-acyltransferase/long-chain-fatty-acid--[acyl-carrier-protein] ligase
MAFTMTFLLALQSAIYGPAKYGYIKELVGEKYISSGNAAIQATTTVAILGGIIFYTVLFEGMYSESLTSEAEILKAIAPIGWLLVIGSLIEWFFASRLPNKMVEASARTFKLKRYLSGAYLRKNMKTVTRKREIFEAIIALSLFWSISQVVLAIFGEYAKSNLHITNTIYVQGVMALAGIGIVVGSIMAAKLSQYFIHMGLVGLGAIGMTLVVVLVPFTDLIGVIAVLFLLFGIFSGFLMVPLNAKIQSLASRVHLGTILAGNNFIQNIFMVTFLALTTLFAYYGMDTEVLFYLMSLVGLYLSFITLRRYPVATFFAVMKIISTLRHNYEYVGLENIPKKGAALLLSNHVSWLDWIIIQLPIDRQINYMMEKEIYHWPIFHAFFAKGGAIPLSARASKNAFLEAHQRLKDGKLVAVFSEGKISRDGKIDKFYKGFERIESDYDGVIIPIFIEGLFGSWFARYKPKQKKGFFKRREIRVYYGEPMSNTSTAQEVKEQIQKMKDKYETQ